MSYDYKIINSDPTTAFVKRVMLYVSILTITVSLALIVLFILFERYLMLLIPGGMILAAIMIMVFIAKVASVVEYHFADHRLTILKKGKEYVFILSDVSFVKNAEKSDFFDKSITILSFIKNKIVVRNAVNDNNFSLNQQVIAYQNERYLIAFDDYGLSLWKGAKQ